MKGWLLFCLILAGCASRPPVVAPRTVEVETLAGKLTYVEEMYRGNPLWTRPDPRRAYELNPEGYKDRLQPENYSSQAVSEILLELFDRSRLEAPASEQELWTRFRKIWEWSVESIRPHPAALQHRRGPMFQGVTLHDHAEWWDRYTYLPEGNAESVTQLFLQLLIQAGVPTDRFALAQCRVPSLASKGRAATHPYAILYINDGWYYFDPNARHLHPWLPREVDKVHSAGFDSYKGHEYTWPFAVSFFAPDPLKGRLPYVRE